MKKLIIASFLALVSIINLNGQWYVKEYHVSDLNFLTKEQLEISLGECRYQLLTSAGVAVLGGIFYLAAKYGDTSIDEDATLFEQLIGEKGMKGIGIAGGLGMLAGGTIASIVYAGRKGSITAALQRKYQYSGAMTLAPTVIPNRTSKTFYPGLTFTYKF